MKVLFIANGWTDYQCDMLMHGLYSLLGSDLTHTCGYTNMYKGHLSKEQLLQLYGRGFTVYGTLPQYLNDSSDIDLKIKNKYFDYIVYGSIRRDNSFLSLVKEVYPKNKICFVEGEDEYHLMDTDGIVLFKRELQFEPTNILKPISFAIPLEKITTNTSIEKINEIAEYKPTSNYSYKYDSEEEYYKNYQIAKFGITSKKAGWDCLRHYEILANYCFPLFKDLAGCPKFTMVNFPKEEVIRINNKFENKDLSENEYYESLNTVFEYTKSNLTTIALAKYVLDTLKNNS